MQVLENNQPVAGAQVYRLMGGEDLGELLGETDPGGYLKGRGEINTGDALVALAPVEATDHYTLYHTNANPNPTGVSAYTVISAGLQELKVSADKPLLLFKLNISLEWDARSDGAFLTDLKSAVERSSELLFDVSDGRMALGEVQIDQAGKNWLTADAVVFANNGIRPRATMGGVVDQATDDRDPRGRPIVAAYQPGQIRMGPNWDPFGENHSDLGEAWWQALAHEFGHYFLYLPDNYLGFDKRGFITHTDCFGSFMTTAYNNSYTEFLTDSEWRDPGHNCQDAIANALTGRSDWATINRFYNQIPPAISANPGPSHLPLDVTRVTINPVDDEREAMTTRNIDLRGANGQRLALPNGQAFLIKTQNTASLDDDRVIALGSSGNRDFIKVARRQPRRPPVHHGRQPRAVPERLSQPADRQQPASERETRPGLAAGYPGAGHCPTDPAGHSHPPERQPGAPGPAVDILRSGPVDHRHPGGRPRSARRIEHIPTGHDHQLPVPDHREPGLPFAGARAQHGGDRHPGKPGRGGVCPDPAGL